MPNHGTPRDVPRLLMTNGWMHVMRATALIPMLILASTHVAPAQELQWSRYSNSQLGVGVDMPTGLFAVDHGPAKNLTGRTFKTSDGRADLSVYAMDNAAR